MIHLHVTVRLRRGKMAEWCELFEEHILPIQRKHGQRLVGAWKTTVGTYDEVTDLYEFEDYVEFQRVRESMFSDPELMKWLPAVSELISDEESKILVPIEFSDCP
jgi:NIPSNAP